METIGGGPVRGLIVCACLAMASCGGGGGGDNDDGGNNPPPPPAGLQPLALEPSSVGTYFDTTFAFFSTARSLAQIGVAAYETFAADSRSITFSCLTGGSVTISLQDNDASGGLSTGDRVRLEYANCASTGSRLNAVLNVDFQTIEVQGGGPISGARVQAAAAGDTNRLVYKVTAASFQDAAPDSTLNLSGSVNVTYTFNADEDHFLITSETLADSVTSRNGSQTLTLRDASYDYRLDNATLSYELSLDGRIDVEAGETQGYFTFETGDPLAGVFNNKPGSGALTIHGAEDGYIRVEPKAADTLRFFYSDDGVSERAEDGAWTTISTFPTILPVQNGVDIPSSTENYQDPQVLNGRRIDLGAPSFDMVFDPARSQIYVSVPARNEIVVVSSVYMNVVARIGVGSRPSGIEISHDGTTLYVANEGNGTVSLIDLDIRTTSGSIDVQSVLGSAHARDVVETQPGVLFVIGASQPVPDPDQTPHIALVRVDRNAADEMHRITVDRDLDDSSRLFADPSGKYLFVFTRGQLLQLDARDASAPLLNEHVGATRDEHIEFSPDGTHLLTWDEALVVDTLAMDPDFKLLAEATRARWSTDGSQVWTQVPYQDSLFDVANSRAAVRIGRYAIDCFDDNFFPVTYRSAGGAAWAFLQRQTLCMVSTVTLDEAPGIASDPPLQPVTVPVQTMVLDLNGFAGGLVVDDVRHRAYISAGPQGIVAVDTQTATIAETFAITGGIPRSLALSPEGNTLYIGLNNPQGIGYFDLTTKSMIRVVDLSADFPFLEYPDVTTLEPNRVLVSSPFGLPGLLDLHPSPSDSYQVIAPSVAFPSTTVVSPDRQTLYVGTFIADPNQLWRVDLSAAPPAVVSADDVFSHTYSRYLAVSPDGSRLYLEHGVVVDSATFKQIGVLGDGLGRPESTGVNVRMAIHLTPVANPEPLTLATYDARSLAITEVAQTECSAYESPVVFPAEGGTRWLMFNGNQQLCIVAPSN